VDVVTPTERIEARRRYQAICEDIFSAWLGDRLPPVGLSSGLTVEYCPEPYLDFSLGDPGILWVTHNPGRGEPFQHRDAVDTPVSPVSAKATYADTSRRLAEWYMGNGRLAISSAARTRIAAMRQLGDELGLHGLRQVELFPLHSEKSPPDAFLFGTPVIAEPLRSYGVHTRALIVSSPVVIGLCGSAPARSGKAIGRWARALQLDLGSAECIVLSDRKPATVGMLLDGSSEHVRILFCRRGSNGLPGRRVMLQVVEAINRALRPVAY
jgi:hypothetical protein